MLRVCSLGMVSPQIYDDCHFSFTIAAGASVKKNKNIRPFRAAALKTVAWIDIGVAQREDKSAVSFNKQSFDVSVIVSTRFMVVP